MPEMWRKRFKVRDLSKAVIAPPPGILHIWEWYQDIALDRGEGFAGVAAITRLNILTWAALSGYKPSPREATLILITDIAWRTEVTRLHKMKTAK